MHGKLGAQERVLRSGRGAGSGQRNADFEIRYDTRDMAVKACMYVARHGSTDGGGRRGQRDRGSIEGHRTLTIFMWPAHSLRCLPRGRPDCLDSVNGARMWSTAPVSMSVATGSMPTTQRECRVGSGGVPLSGAMQSGCGREDRGGETTEGCVGSVWQAAQLRQAGDRSRDSNSR